MPELHLPSKADVDRLRQAVIGNSELVEQLAGRLDDVERTIRNIRILAVLLAVFVGVFAAAAWFVSNELHQNAVTGCENANETRLATENLWLGVLGDSTPETPTQAKALKELEAHIKVVFQQRDCDDLDREYVIPEYPDLKLD